MLPFSPWCERQQSGCLTQVRFQQLKCAQPWLFVTLQAPMVCFAHNSLTREGSTTCVHVPSTFGSLLFLSFRCCTEVSHYQAHLKPGEIIQSQLKKVYTYAGCLSTDDHSGTHTTTAKLHSVLPLTVILLLVCYKGLPLSGKAKVANAWSILLQCR